MIFKQCATCQEFIGIKYLSTSCPKCKGSFKKRLYMQCQECSTMRAVYTEKCPCCDEERLVGQLKQIKFYTEGVFTSRLTVEFDLAEGQYIDSVYVGGHEIISDITLTRKNNGLTKACVYLKSPLSTIPKFITAKVVSDG